MLLQNNYLEFKYNWPRWVSKAHQRVLPIHLCYYNFTCLYITGSSSADVCESDHARYLSVMQTCTCDYQLLIFYFDIILYRLFPVERWTTLSWVLCFCSSLIHHLGWICSVLLDSKRSKYCCCTVAELPGCLWA